MCAFLFEVRKVNTHIIKYVDGRGAEHVLTIESDKKIRQVASDRVLIYGQIITVQGTIKNIVTN